MYIEDVYTLKKRDIHETTPHYTFEIFLLCLFSLFLFSDVVAQKPGLVPLDSLITVGYATGSIKNLSGSVEKITELQMNRDQITNPLDAIRGRVPGLTIQRGTNGRPPWMPFACGVPPL